MRNAFPTLVVSPAWRVLACGGGAACLPVMGCCTSRNQRAGQRIWYMPWKRRRPRRPVDTSTVQPPSSGRYANSIGYSYEKTTASAQSDMSSRMMDAPTYVGLWQYGPGSKAELSIRQGDRYRQMGDPSGEMYVLLLLPHCRHDGLSKLGFPFFYGP